MTGVPKAVWHLLGKAVITLSGVYMLGLTVLTGVLALVGRPISPSTTLVVISCMAVAAFIFSTFGLIKHERLRADAAVQEVRNARRAQEAKSINVPRGLKVAALVFQSQPASRITQESDRELARTIDEATRRLNSDSVYIIRREKMADTFGPFTDRTRRYGWLSWTDARAEVVRLRELGMVEKASADNEREQYRWTAFGYAVIGKLGPKLRWWRWIR